MQKQVLYIENTEALNIIRDAMQYLNMRQDVLRQEYKTALLNVRGYIVANRAGAYDYLQSYPCGYQDAHADKMRGAAEKARALKIAYQLKRGFANEFNLLSQIATGGL